MTPVEECDKCGFLDIVEFGTIVDEFFGTVFVCGACTNEYL